MMSRITNNIKLPIVVDGGEEENLATIMESFWFPLSQCLATPQMYHFCPRVFMLIISFPLVKGTALAGATLCWKPMPSTLMTLWFPCG